MHYNGPVNIKNTLILLVMTIAVTAGVLPASIQAAAPNADQLVSAVNAYRASNGYYTMNPHPLVYQAAQRHAEWIVDTGQGGHIGEAGSDETIRVSWTGYGGGAAIQCDENWTSSRTIEDALYGSWADWTHQEVMLNQWGNRYTDIGAGVAAWGDDRYVLILNVCKVIGQEASGDIPDTNNEDPGASIPPTPDYSNYIYGVTTATPQPDGTVTHIVQYGQTLASIAEAYSITIEELRALNNFAADFTAIWPDDELIIQPGAGGSAPASTTPTVQTETASQQDAPTPTPDVTTTPTLTPRPTYTPSAMDLTATAQAQIEAKETATGGEEAIEREPITSSLTAGTLLLVFAGLGLVIVVYFSSINKDIK